MKDADNIIDSTFGVRLSCRGQACVICAFVTICFQTQTIVKTMEPENTHVPITQA